MTTARDEPRGLAMASRVTPGVAVRRGRDEAVGEGDLDERRHQRQSTSPRGRRARGEANSATSGDMTTARDEPRGLAMGTRVAPGVAVRRRGDEAVGEGGFMERRHQRRPTSPWDRGTSAGAKNGTWRGSARPPTTPDVPSRQETDSDSSAPMHRRRPGGMLVCS